MCVIDRACGGLEANSQGHGAKRPHLRLGRAPVLFLSGRGWRSYPFFNVMDDSQPPYGDEERNTLRILTEKPPALIVDHFKNVKMANRAGWSDLLARHYRLFLDGEEIRLYLRLDKTRRSRTIHRETPNQ
jgi:hypothetical protein